MTLPAAHPARGWALDAAVATAVTAVMIVLSGHIPVGAHSRGVDGLALVLLAIAGISMGVCRRWPRAATVAVTLALCGFIARDYPNSPIWITGWVVLVVLAWRTGRRTAIIGAAGMMAALSVTAAAFSSGGLLESALYIGWGGAAIFLGDGVRSRGRYLAERRERAAATERSQEDEFARRLAEDRLRIARDLHDGVAHAMTTINVQAGAAAHVLTRRPEVAAEALTVIQRASGEVLDELTVMLNVLRAEDQHADRVPTPGLWDVARLVDGTAASGLTVTLSLDAPPQHLAPSISTAAYRVVQESLTNVLRHSVARQAEVHVCARPGAPIEVDVVDAGPARLDRTDGTGVGIRGMRERVTSTGGLFDAGPTEPGGFAVHARWRRPA
ncbi:MAG TPA: histidine kinase [Flexivirga sp.]|uniref:sensor histidine kinase n=1 Tax=Flexivirga sp. TaxID=1962927 RepID=UPI002CE3CCD0|nr:histidine kinase [Flexivirga sp.]HWC22875.1 histidine kinase [Flexivirga sp.]